MDNTPLPTSSQTHSPKNDLGPLLSSEHARLEQLFEEMLSAFQADARVEARTLWNQFDSQLRAHMALEETRILPRLAEANAPEAAALRREHDILREKLLQLGIGVDLHVTRDAHVEDFLRVLRAHAKREDGLMYRFCAEH
jgi:hemerythrin superfamily protein